MPFPKYTREQRIVAFWQKVDKSGGADACWNWTAARFIESGYGACKWGSNNWGAHRVSWTIHHGDIRDGLFVLHSCDNRLCVNPSHLFLGTHADNMDDMRRKGRAATGARHVSVAHPDRLARGERHWSRTHPERLPFGEKNGNYTHPEKRPRGESSGNHKLTENQIVEIRARATKHNKVSLAEEYGVNLSTIYRIVVKKTWTHVRQKE